MRVCAANAGISSAAGKNVRGVLTSWRPCGNAGPREARAGRRERGREKNRDRREKESNEKNRRKGPGREIFIWLRPVTDASPGCRSNRGGVAAGKMNPGVPYKRPIA